MAGQSGRDHEALFCDTNVLVRFLTNDPASQADAATRILGSPDVRILLTDAVVAEVCYVMTRVAGASRADVAARLVDVMSLPSIHVGDRFVLTDALHLWTHEGIGFLDAYLCALTRRTPQTAVLSFDRDFDTIEGVERVDPGRY